MDRGGRQDAAAVWTYRWSAPESEATTVILAFDGVHRIRYVHVSAGPDRDAILDMLMGHFENATVDELRADCAEIGADDPAAYVRLGLALGDNDPASADLLRAGLRSPDPEVRGRVIAASEVS